MVTDISGRMVKRFEMDDGSVPLNESDLSPGVDVLRENNRFHLFLRKDWTRI